MKFGLGTVQFGMPYGVTNSKGQCSLSEIINILKIANANNVSTLDTAAAYGESEKMLGEAFAQLAQPSFDVVTKIPAHCSAEKIPTIFETSCQHLNQESLYGLLLHDAQSLIGCDGEKIWDQLQLLKMQGKVKKIGVSIYTAEQIDFLLEHYPIDLIQLPINVFDQHLQKEGYLRRLKEAGVIIHARSIFLQGVILADPKILPAKLDPLKQAVIRFHQYCQKNEMTALQAALLYISSQVEIDCAVVGVTSGDELLTILAALKALPKQRVDFSECAFLDRVWVNPASWV